MIWEKIIRFVKDKLGKPIKIIPVITYKDEYNPNTGRVLIGEFYTRDFRIEWARRDLEQFIEENYSDKILDISYANTKFIDEAYEIKNKEEPFPELRRKR